MKGYKFILVIASMIISMSAWAQKLSIGYLYPAGGETGTTVEIEAGGLNIHKATRVVFNHPGIKGEVFPYVEKGSKKKKSRKLNDQSSPQLADKIMIRINIDSNVPCGLYDLRLQSPQGGSNMLPFEVSSYPNLMESGKSTHYKPDEVKSLPAVICGQATPGGIDYFRFSGKKGDKIVASVKGRTLVPYIADAVPGWFQPVIKIVDHRGKEVGYSDDYQSNPDPVIITELPKDGQYTLMIHDAIYRGRQDFNYRIQLGVIPFVTGRYPAYGIVGKKVRQEIEGVNLDDSKATISVKKEGYHQFTYTTDTGTSNAVSFYALPKGTSLIHFPESGKTLTINTAISDSLTKDNKIKSYRITVEDNQPISIELIGRRNGSRIDAVMKLKDSFGNVVAEADDKEDPMQGTMTFHADPVLNYRPRHNETLVLEVSDLHRGYGKDYHFLMRMKKQQADVNAFVTPANISVPSGGTASFHVDIEGKVKRPVRLAINGLPKGFVTNNLELGSTKSWDFSITAPKGAELERIPIELKLYYPSKDGEEQTKVLPADNMMQAFYYVHHIQAAELSLEVTEASPYRLSVAMNPDRGISFTFADEVIPVKVIIDRDPGFNEQIDLELGKKNRLFSLEPVTIMPDEKEKTIYIKLDQKVIASYKGKKFLPTLQMNIIGTVKGEIVKQGKRTFQNAKYREMTPFFMLRMKK
jgi:hypothetical protein